ncbi:CaiB/BaiF CoA transferase family protein [Haloplanus pelagicus]|jgi:crotonobetainyl-CoA:carnitine CoA-transferase CaiB-like acyl-CoA transferase|uniref:CaiB/BaiF CoA transferase family protein n=1 Tax=Haloplanus pelagicus TaxID=2949995 RepID=UPI0020401A8F|nr:CaiB/BaiF CoA-transferase family protein [Haloplanus sp. HW8-1]
MNGPLDGVRVLDLGQIFMGPYCGFVLSGLGADVVKIEPPGGETIRSRDDDGYPPAYYFYNSNKRDVVIDLKSAEGKELFRELVAEADVLVENFGPGTMDRLGLGYEALSEVNPELVYAHGSGYGEYGPYRDDPAMDLAIQARGGVMTTTGFPDGPPIRAGPGIADILGGIHLATGVVGALYERDRTGEGTYVDVGMFDCVYPTLASPVTAHLEGAEEPLRFGNRHAGGSLAPYNAYETTDGYVVVICVTDEQWARLADEMGEPWLAEDDRFATKVDRANHVDEVDELVQAWVETQEKDAVATRLNERGIPCAPVQTLAEVTSDPQLHARGMINHVESDGSHDEEIPTPGVPIRFDGDAPTVSKAPRLGEHTDEVFRELGYSQTTLEAFRESDVIE